MSAPSRRELNKARTRGRLLEALRTQLAQGSLDSMTVEDVSEAAGVSRRTFFNYFSSLEAALSEGMSVPIAGMTEAFMARPADEEPLPAMIQALEVSPIPRDLLSWINAVRCSGLERHSVAVNVWSYHQQWFAELLRERMPQASDLVIGTLARTVLAIFEAVEDQWAQDASEVVDEAATQAFNDLLRQGLRLAAAGWTGQAGDPGSSAVPAPAGQSSGSSTA